MATGLAARFAVAADFEFQKRVAQALAETAVSVYGEANPPANHGLRAAYSLAVIADPPLQLVFNGPPIEAHSRSFAVARLLTTMGIDSTSTDAQITAAVANVWNALAGA